MTQSQTMAYESITTTYESRWVHDCCLLFSAIWNYGYDLFSMSSSLHGNCYM